MGQGQTGAIHPTTVLVTSTTRPKLTRSPSWGRVARNSPTVRARSCSEPNYLFGRLQPLKGRLGPDPAGASLQLPTTHLPSAPSPTARP
jgi:hypothetical protein